MEAYVFKTQDVGKGFLKQSLAQVGYSQFAAACIEYFDVVYSQDEIQFFQLRDVKILPYTVGYNEGFGSRMVDDVMNARRFEVVQDGDGYASIAQDAKEVHGPSGRITAYQGNFVTRFHFGSFQQEAYLDYSFGKIAVFVGFTQII